MLRIIIFIIIFSYFKPTASLPDIDIYPENLEEFRVGELRNLTITFNEWDNSLLNVNENFFRIKCENVGICRVKEVYEITPSLINSTSPTFNVTIEAIFLGITNVIITDNNFTSLTEPYNVRVMRAAFYCHISTAFTFIIGIFIIMVTFMMGTQLEWARIKEVMKKPVGPCIGFLCQFVLMPLTGYMLAEFGFNDDEVVLKLALFAASTCPGGGKSSFWTIIYGGNLDLSVAMTFTQTISALFMMPFWLSTLAKRFTTQRVEIPFMAIIEGLLVLIIPSAAGMYFIHHKPHLLEKIEKYIKRCTWVATIFFTVFGVWANWYVFLLFTWKTVLLGCMLPMSGYIIAFITAWICRQSYQNCITTAIETGVQNIGIAIILMMWCLPEPEVDISLTVLFAIMLSTDKPLIILWLILKCCRKEITTEKSTEKVGKYEAKSETVEITDGNKDKEANETQGGSV